MGNAPAAARLTIVSLRATAVINTLWAAFVAAAATVLLLRGGSAWQAMGVYYLGHVLSATLVLLVLKRKDNLPKGMISLFAMAMVALALGSGLAMLRAAAPERLGSTTAGLLGILVAASLALWWMGKRHNWLPSREAIRSLLAKVQRFAGARLRRV